MSPLTDDGPRAIQNSLSNQELRTDAEKGGSYGQISSDSQARRGTDDSNEHLVGVSQPTQTEDPQTWKATWERLIQRKEPPPANPNAQRRLRWPQLTICLLVEAVALGTLCIGDAFRAMGMGPGIAVSITLGFITGYTALVIGKVKERFPGVQHYADAVGLILGPLGYEVASAMFIALLVVILGSHTLTGTIAFNRLIDDGKVCVVGYGAVSAVLLFLLVLPPSFIQFAILGYIDFCSIIAAVSVVCIASGIHAFNLPGGASSVDWTWAPPPDATFQSLFLGTTNIIFAYTFAVAMFSFMSEMQDVREHPKAVCALGVVQTSIYTATGAMTYAWVGSGIQSPVLLSAQPLVVSKVAFGLALPVIYISGSINSNVVGSYIFDRWLPGLRERRNRKFWILWPSLLAGITVASWIIATSIPFFNALLGLISSLFTSGFTFYFPALFWFMLIREGKWNSTWSNVVQTALNALVLTIGVVLFFCGTYVSIWQIIHEYKEGSVKMPFACSGTEYG